MRTSADADTGQAIGLESCLDDLSFRVRELEAQMAALRSMMARLEDRLRSEASQDDSASDG